MPTPTSPSLNKKGFTLIELLVVIAIIAILAVTGYAVFTGVTKAARDSKRKSDVEAIAKAYEVKYSPTTGKYSSLLDSDFANGVTPKDADNTTNYFNVVDSLTGTGYKVCAALDNNPQRVCNTPANNCYCRVSAQGTIPTNIPPANLTGTNTQYGMGGSSSQTCDPNGTLLSGLVGYWKMDEGTGTTVSDSSGNGNNGVWNGAGTHWATGKSGYAGDFNGTNDKVTTGSTIVGTNMTIAGWIKKTASTGQKSFFSNRNSGAVYFGLSGTSVFMYDNAGTPQSALSSSGAVTIGQWQQVVATSDGTTTKFYVNGVPLPTISQTRTSSTGTVGIGWDPSIGTEYWDGQLDDVRIYNRALSPTEVTSLYNSGSGCIP